VPEKYYEEGDFKGPYDRVGRGRIAHQEIMLVKNTSARNTRVMFFYPIVIYVADLIMAGYQFEPFHKIVSLIYSERFC